MTEVTVIGAGAIGLHAALALQERGHVVRVIARETTTRTTSAVAAALWYPYLAEPRDRVLGWSRTTLVWLLAQAADPAAGIDIVPVRELLRPGDGAPFWARPGEVTVRGDVLTARLPICDTSVHLPWLLQRVIAGGARLEQRAVRSFDEVDAACIVNCSGLGARELCGDRGLTAVRGQVLVVDRGAVREAVLDDRDGPPIYILPRRDDVVLGGTAQHGDERLTADDGDARSIRARCAALVPEVAALPLRMHKVGLRPYRSAVRLECERHGGRLIVHDYGHGGSGHTLARGCAEEVARLVQPPS